MSTYVHPLPSGTDARNFGQDRGDHIHAGTDISAPSGTPVLAVTAGTISAVKPLNGAAGNTIHLTDAAGNVYKYFHLSAFSVVPGQKVTAGQEVGKVGNTGRSTGPHLHFEYHPGGAAAADPSPILAGASTSAATGFAGVGAAVAGATTAGQAQGATGIPLPGAGAVNLLTDPNTWRRVTMVGAGGGLVVLGTYFLIRDTKAGQALQAATLDAAKVAAIGPAGAAL